MTSSVSRAPPPPPRAARGTENGENREEEEVLTGACGGGGGGAAGSQPWISGGGNGEASRLTLSSLSLSRRQPPLLSLSRLLGHGGNELGGRKEDKEEGGGERGKEKEGRGVVGGGKEKGNLCKGTGETEERSDSLSKSPPPPKLPKPSWEEWPTISGIVRWGGSF